MNKQAITEQLAQAIWASENALALSEDPFIKTNSAVLKANLSKIARAFSGSWIGYHANVYYRDFEAPPPGDHFSSEWGLMEGFISNPMSGDWVEYAPETVRQALMDGVDPEYGSRLSAISVQAQKALEENYETVRTLLEVLQTDSKSPTLQRIFEDLSSLHLQMSATDVIKAVGPKGHFATRDNLAISQGICTPVHIKVHADEFEWLYPFTALDTLVGCGRRILKYMEINDLVERVNMPAGKKVFIGHGRSASWRELKDFFQDRLHLQWDEFNREPIAGISTTERLQQMLDTSAMAFLIMTAEDEHADQSLHARENVIHEVGLFQGRLGFRRAIILLEEGCKEFSNISGLSQLRFPSGNISAKFEEIRRVLEREGII